MSFSRRAVLSGVIAIGATARLRTAQAQTAASPYGLDPLPYPANRNEPHIDAQTMTLHHDRHHAAYVANLNAALKDQGEAAKLPLHGLLAKLGDLPETVRTTVRNNGGGHANHTMFWQIMGARGGEPTGELRAAIDRDLGGPAKMMDDFNAMGTRLFGSGWIFVTVDRTGRLSLASRPNQDTPLMDGGRVLFGNDVWEHAYYLKYNNRRADYLKAWWNVVSWDVVGTRYAAAKAGTLTI